MSSVIEIVKAKIDVVEEIGLIVPLQKSGKAFKGHCPFHNEHTPSFYVFPESQHWHCFGCNEGGDVLTFVQKQQGIDFREALSSLASKVGISVDDHRNPESLEQEREVNALRERLRKLNEEALLWFHTMLLRSKSAAEARAYVQRRGISTDSVIAFGLGHAPDQRDSLSRYLLKQGYTEHEIVSGGLARERDDGGSGESAPYDYFRDRLIFPIRDIRGQVIGFGGRILGSGQPKYLNSPQTLLFEKNRALYAIDRAKETIKQARQVVIVEGYVDAIIAHQYGTRQTVACIGSAITEKHIQQLKKLTKQVTLALDPDAAGENATERGIQEALKTFDRMIVPVPVAVEHTGSKHSGHHSRGMIRLEEQVDAEINVLQLPAGKDPDEVIRDDFSAWFYAVSHPLPLIEYYFAAKITDLDLRQPNGKTEAAKRLLPVIGMISDRIKRDAYLQKLAAMINIEERLLHTELQHVLKGQRTPVSTAEFSGSEFKGVRKSLSPVINNTGFVNNREEYGQDAQEEEQKPILWLDKKKNDRLQWEYYLIGLLLQNPEAYSLVYGIMSDGDFVGADTRELYCMLNSVYQQSSSSFQQPFEQLVPSVLLTAVAKAHKSIELGPPLDGVGQLKAAVQCATRLKRSRLVQLNTELQYLIREAKKDTDSTIVQQLMHQLLALQQQVRTIDSATHLQG